VLVRWSRANRLISRWWRGDVIRDLHNTAAGYEAELPAKHSTPFSPAGIPM
jgi:hypothetical protein